MLDTTVTIATAARRVNSVFILLNNRMPLAGIKDTSSSLLERKKKKETKNKTKKNWQGNDNSCTNTRKQREMLFLLIPSPKCLNYVKLDTIVFKCIICQLNYKIFICSMFRNGKNDDHFIIRTYTSILPF